VENRLRFGDFEFDATSGELRRIDGAGEGQRLPPQPARLLQLLVERQGSIVTRDEIRERLWPDTHVDFDTSLHFCVRQVRAALDDSADEPRYVQNVPRRGYRLLPAVARPEPPEPPATTPVRDRRRVVAWLLASLMIVALGTAYFYGSGQRQPIRIAIMPFEPPPGRADLSGWRNVAEWILEDLTAVAGKSAGVVGPTTTSAYDGSDASLPQLAADLDIHFIVNARFLHAQGASRVLAELIRVSDGAHVWVRAYDDPGDGERLGREISRHVARELGLDSDAR
jgi:DNA-binding winged helix-turn-helix (wHTH) protein/TolB-like protein